MENSENCKPTGEKHLEVIVMRLDECLAQYEQNIDRLFKSVGRIHDENRVASEKVDNTSEKTGDSGLVPELRNRLDKLVVYNDALSGLCRRMEGFV